MRGLAWTGAARWGAQLLSWSATLVVARFLSPTDYGIVGMATVYLGIVQLVNEFGLSAAVVQGRDLDESQRASLGGLSVVLGVFFLILSVALSGRIAGFFHQPVVRPVVIALSTTFLITGFRVLPSALLSRDLDFRRLARIDATEAVVQTACTLALAVSGFGYWSLVIGAISGTVVSTSLALVARPHRLSLPRALGPIVEPVRLGWHLTLSRVGWYVYSNADFAVVGRVLGTAPLGAYTFGWQIASIPVEKVSGIVGRVVLPLFAQVQDDHAALRRYVRGLTEGLALVTFPLAFGLALVAAPFVRLVLGSRWEAAIAPLQLLALYAGVRSLMTLLPQVLTVIGRARWAMWFNLVLTVVMPAAFLVGAHWGTRGVAMAWVIVYPLVTVPMLVLYTLRAIDLPVAAYLRSLWPAASSTAVMAVAVLAIAQVAHGNLLLPAQVGGGAVAYGAMLWLVHADRVRAFYGLARSSRR